jgi:hypothetical protein
MSKTSWTVVSVVAAAIVGGAVFLATWDIPPPTARQEIVIPDDRLPR